MILNCCMAVEAAVYSCKWWYGHERLLPGRRICGIIMKIGVGHVTLCTVMER